MSQTTVTLETAQGYLQEISNDESLLERATKYLHRLVKQMTYDPTLMTKEEYFAKLDKSEAQYERGEYYEQRPGESFMDMLNRYRADYHV